MQLNEKELVVDFVRLSRLFSKVRIPRVWQGELLVLAYLKRRAERIALPLDIKNDLDLTSARVSAILNALEKKGHIIRSMAPGDRRKVLVELTPEGVRFYEGQLEDAAHSLSPLLLRMGRRDAGVFIELLHKLADILEQMDRESRRPGG